jgi:hypothetical protein
MGGLNEVTKFKKCDKREASLNQCLSTAIHNAITRLDKPLGHYGLPSLEPFVVESVTAKDGIKLGFH